MMVKQTRIIFELGDTRALRLQCGECGREAVQPVAATDTPKDCPFCGLPWENEYTTGMREDNWQLVRAMQRLLKYEHRMTIRFEIDGEAS